MWRRLLCLCVCVSASAAAGNVVHLRFREAAVWLACHMRDAPANHSAADANDLDVVFNAHGSGTRYECRFDTSEEHRAGLRRREMLPIGPGIVMMKYEDEHWFSGDLPPFDCLTARTGLPRWLFDLEARRPPTPASEAALCNWTRHRLRGWRGLSALAPLSLDFPHLPTVACAMAPPPEFSEGTPSFTLPGLTDNPLVCIFRTYRDFPGLAEEQAASQLEELQRSLEAALQPHPSAAVRCERVDALAAAAAPPAPGKRLAFTVRSAGGYGARCRVKG